MPLSVSRARPKCSNSWVSPYFSFYCTCLCDFNAAERAAKMKRMVTGRKTDYWWWFIDGMYAIWLLFWCAFAQLSWCHWCLGVLSKLPFIFRYASTYFIIKGRPRQEIIDGLGFMHILPHDIFDITSIYFYIALIYAYFQAFLYRWYLRQENVSSRVFKYLYILHSLFRI